MAAYKTYIQAKVLLPSCVTSERGICVISRMHSSSPHQLVLLFTNHRFLTPCYNFLVRVLTPPHRLSIPLFSSPRLITHQQPAGVSGWHLSAGDGGCLPFGSLQRWMIFHSNFSLSLFFALYCDAAATHFLWRGDSCQMKWVYKWTAN